MKAKNILLDFKPFHIEAKYNARLKYFFVSFSNGSIINWMQQWL